jgi:hypothetical protein
LFRQNFEILFIICAKILIKSKVQCCILRKPSNTMAQNWKLRQSRHIRLFHYIDWTPVISSYNQYPEKKIKIKKPSAKVKILNLINYLVVCCWNKCTMVLCIDFLLELENVKDIAHITKRFYNSVVRSNMKICFFMVFDSRLYTIGKEHVVEVLASS